MNSQGFCEADGNSRRHTLRQRRARGSLRHPAFQKEGKRAITAAIVSSPTQTFEPTPEQIRAIAKRGDGGIGCDQVIAIDPPRAEGASAYVRFWNADGEPAGACGNGTRCVAWLLMRSAGKTAVAFSIPQHD